MTLRVEVVSALESLWARALRTRERQEKIDHEVDKLHVLKAGRVRIRHDPLDNFKRYWLARLGRHIRKYFNGLHPRVLPTRAKVRLRRMMSSLPEPRTGGDSAAHD
eukprot:6588604-Prymnesium_polylepis.1